MSRLVGYAQSAERRSKAHKEEGTGDSYGGGRIRTPSLAWKNAAGGRFEKIGGGGIV